MVVALAMAAAIGSRTIAPWLIGSQTTALWPGEKEYDKT